MVDVIRLPKGILTVDLVPAKLDCMRSLAVVALPDVSFEEARGFKWLQEPLYRWT